MSTRLALVFFLGCIKDSFSFFPLSLEDFKTRIFLGHFNILGSRSSHLYFVILDLQHLDGVCCSHFWVPPGYAPSRTALTRLDESTLVLRTQNKTLLGAENTREEKSRQAPRLCRLLFGAWSEAQVQTHGSTQVIQLLGLPMVFPVCPSAPQNHVPKIPPHT